jgi:hypothetical protein
MTDHRLCALGAVVLIGLGAAAVTPAHAYTDFSGVWGAITQEDWAERAPGSEIGDFGGLPINAAARRRAESWDPSLFAIPEYQCRVHAADYAQNFSDNRIWEERDRETQKLIAIHIHYFAWQTERTIWMDGRKHPSDLEPYTSMGYSTGKFMGPDNAILRIDTDHLLEFYIRRNGVPRSDKATVIEYLDMHDDNKLTWTVIIDDPIYLEEPFIRNRDFDRTIDRPLAPYPCEETIEVVRPEGQIPSYLPGQNKFLIEYAQRHNIPFEATQGGAATMYPEYQKKIAKMPPPPKPDKPLSNFSFGR